MKPKPTPRVEQLWSDAEKAAEELGHWWLGTEHLLLALAEDRRRHAGGGLAGSVLDEVAPGWETDVTKRLLKRLSDLDLAEMKRRKPRVGRCASEQGPG